MVLKMSLHANGWKNAKYKCFVISIEEWNKTRTQKKEKKEKTGFSAVCLCTRDVQCSACSSILLIDSVSKPYIYLISLDTGADPEKFR